MLFSKKILDWFSECGRTLPWRGIDDPYKIWLSEIILQQTRIEQGREYYFRFVEQYPTVVHLAQAEEEDVLKTWQGLGYYSRARNLHASARYIASELHGVFPTTYEGILKLKGVGRYTAAAIASFAYRMPYPVIDGNVYRFVSRLFGIDTPIGTDAAYKEFEELLARLIDKDRPDLFNHAIMDFGSTYCKPSGCDCDNCIFRNECVARKEGRVELLPVKGSATKVKTRWFYYIYISWNENDRAYSMMHRREGKDIWKGLYEFPLIETEVALTDEEATERGRQMAVSMGFDRIAGASIGAPVKHQLTHRTIVAAMVSIEAEGHPKNLMGETAMAIDKAHNYPISRLMEIFTTKAGWPTGKSEG